MTDDLPFGGKLGKYKIERLLGQGGMATVYLGYQEEIDRHVAIKVLPPHPGQDPQFIDRFQQEAKTIARLQHPHILPVFDFGTQDNVLYLVMPYVQGGSLGDMMGKNPLQPEEIAKLLWDIASAVSYAHRNGVVHRDIKPDNILLDEEGNALLSDFGIAKLVESNTQYTATGGFLGTPAYMAPEQGQGLSEIDGRADVYALGVMVFEMLTGRHPYSAETPMMVMFKHVSDPVPSLLEVSPHFSIELDTVLRKALAKNRDDRYASATEFAQAINEVITGSRRVESYRTPTPPPSSTATMPDQPTTLGSAKVEEKDPRTVIFSESGTSPFGGSRGTSRGVMFGALLIVIGIVAIAFLLLNSGDEDSGPVANAPTATEKPSPGPTEIPTEIPVPTDTPAPTATPIPNFGLLEFSTVNAAGDTAHIEVIGLAPAGQGMEYQAWLFSTKEMTWLALGRLPIDAVGNGQVNFTAPRGENLYLIYDAVALSVEPAESSPDAPAGEIAYSGVLFPAIADALYQIIIKWTPEDANLNPRELSLIDIAKQEYATAHQHAKLAMGDAQKDNPGGMWGHLEHTYNIIQGTNEDIAGNGTQGNNPSNLKIGLLPAVDAIYGFLTEAANSPETSSALQLEVIKVQTCAGNVLFWTDEMSVAAFDHVTAEDTETALLEIEPAFTAFEPVESGLDSNENGVIEPTEGECGLDSISPFAVSINQIALYDGIDPALESAMTPGE